MPGGAREGPGLPLLARRLVPDKVRDLANGLRALPREAGLRLGRPSREECAARVRGPVGADALPPAPAGPPLAVTGTARELAQLAERVPGVARAGPVRRRLTGVPGVGPPTAPAFRATVDRPGRLGPTPERRRSGGTDVQGGISRRGDGPARTASDEAARSPLVRSRGRPGLRARGPRVAERRGVARARVAVARKLARVLHRMWADGSEFRRGEEGAMPAA